MRKQLATAQKEYFALRVSNETREQEYLQQKTDRDLHIGLNDERRIKQIKINIEDASRKSKFMEDEVKSILERWHGRMVVVRKQLEEDQSRNEGKVLGELVDKYIQQLFDKNKKMVDLSRSKEEIEFQVKNSANEN